MGKFSATWNWSLLLNFNFIYSFLFDFVNPFTVNVKQKITAGIIFPYSSLLFLITYSYWDLDWTLCLHLSLFFSLSMWDLQIWIHSWSSQFSSQKFWGLLYELHDGHILFVSQVFKTLRCNFNCLVYVVFHSFINPMLVV